MPTIKQAISKVVFGKNTKPQVKNQFRAILRGKEDLIVEVSKKHAYSKN
jgi:hypothetical protein